jgi:hypothetical protein
MAALRRAQGGGHTPLGQVDVKMCDVVVLAKAGVVCSLIGADSTADDDSALVRVKSWHPSPGH